MLLVTVFSQINGKSIDVPLSASFEEIYPDDILTANCKPGIPYTILQLV